LLLVLNLVVTGMVILLMALAVKLRSTIDPGFMGVALVMMMSMGQILAGFIQDWTSLETSLGAVGRIKAFSEETPSEVLPHENVQADDTWPVEGGIEIHNLTAAHNSYSDPVLRDITMSIQPGQKIGLCGRTGR
jgi:ABC-type multidrug transport system fused ATPase/permease subunit